MSRPTALVTGASSGIGTVYAEKLAQRGHDLVLVARDQARLEDLAARLRASTGASVTVLAADLTEPAQLARVQAEFQSNPTIALLVNNAGMALSGDLLDASSEIETLIALNVTAPTRLAAAAVRAFLSKGHGTIVNISSVLALAPEVAEPAYGASKAYLLHLTQALAARFSNAGLRFQAVLPGVTRTEIWERSGRDIGTFSSQVVMEADAAVEAALTGLELGEAVTMPALAEIDQWDAMEAARIAMAPNLSRRDVARRYLAHPARDSRSPAKTRESQDHALQG